MKKIKNIGLIDDCETSKSIRQLGLLSILSGFDKDVIKEATSKLLANIVNGEEKRRPLKTCRRQPSRYPKGVREKLKNLTRHHETQRGGVGANSLHHRPQ